MGRVAQGAAGLGLVTARSTHGFGASFLPASALRVVELEDHSAAQSRVITLYIDGQPTALTCRVVGPAPGCSDAEHTVTIPAGSMISFARTLGSESGGDYGNTTLMTWLASPAS